jgi:DNA-binding cell septation regulator SpoVG
MKVVSLFVNPFKNQSKKAVASVTVELGLEGGGSIWLRGLTLVEGSGGLFLSFPARKKEVEGEDGKQTEWEDYFFFGGKGGPSKTAKDELTAAAVKEYKAKQAKKG